MPACVTGSAPGSTALACTRIRTGQGENCRFRYVSLFRSLSLSRSFSHIGQPPDPPHSPARVVRVVYPRGRHWQRPRVHSTRLHSDQDGAGFSLSLSLALTRSLSLARSLSLSLSKPGQPPDPPHSPERGVRVDASSISFGETLRGEKQSGSEFRDKDSGGWQTRGWLSQEIFIHRIHRARRALGGVPREQKMFKGHLPRVIYHQVY